MAAFLGETSNEAWCQRELFMVYDEEKSCALTKTALIGTFQLRKTGQGALVLVCEGNIRG